MVVMLGHFSLCVCGGGGSFWSLYDERSQIKANLYSSIFLFAFYSTKKKKMADKILPQRVSIYFVEIK